MHVFLVWMVVSSSALVVAAAPIVAMVLFGLDVVRQPSSVTNWRTAWWFALLVCGLGPVVGWGLSGAVGAGAVSDLGFSVVLAILNVGAVGSLLLLALGAARRLRPGGELDPDRWWVPVLVGMAVSAGFLLAPALPNHGVRVNWAPYVHMLSVGFALSAWGVLLGGRSGLRYEEGRRLGAEIVGGWALCAAQLSVCWALFADNPDGAHPLLLVAPGVLSAGVVLAVVLPARPRPLSLTLALFPVVAWGLARWMTFSWMALVSDRSLPVAGPLWLAGRPASVDCVEVGVDRARRGPCRSWGMSARALSGDLPSTLVRPGDILLVDNRWRGLQLDRVGRRTGQHHQVSSPRPGSWDLDGTLGITWEVLLGRVETMSYADRLVIQPAAWVDVQALITLCTNTKAACQVAPPKP